MKEIIAYIKSERTTEVLEELHLIEGLTGVTFFEVQGFGRSRNKEEGVRINDDLLGFSPHTKIEIFCLDKVAAQVVTAIEKGAHTGLRADGKIYIKTIDDAIRISTMESGDVAV